MTERSRFDSARRSSAIRWAVALCFWTLFIWCHSLMQGPQSSAESGVVVDMLAPLFEALGITDVDVVTTAVRKGAHVCEYAVLGVLAWGLHRSLRPAHGRRVFLLVLMVVFVPVCDEAIQLFVPGRSGRLSDVFVDLAGLCLGAFLAAGLSRLRSRARA